LAVKAALDWNELPASGRSGRTIKGIAGLPANPTSDNTLSITHGALAAPATQAGKGSVREGRGTSCAALSVGYGGS